MYVCMYVFAEYNVRNQQRKVHFVNAPDTTILNDKHRYDETS